MGFRAALVVLATLRECHSAKAPAAALADDLIRVSGHRAVPAHECGMVLRVREPTQPPDVGATRQQEFAGAATREVDLVQWRSKLV